MQILFSADFYEDLDEIVFYSRIFYYGDETRVRDFVALMYEEIFKQLGNALQHGTFVEHVDGVEIRSLPIRKIFRIFFREEGESRTVLAIRSMRSLR